MTAKLIIVQGNLFPIKLCLISLCSLSHNKIFSIQISLSFYLFIYLGSSSVIERIMYKHMYDNIWALQWALDDMIKKVLMIGWPYIISYFFPLNCISHGAQ